MTYELSTEISKILKESKKRESTLAAAVVLVTVEGAGTAAAVSETINFGGTFLVPPAGGALQIAATDTNGNPVPLHVSIHSFSQDSRGCYDKARIQVISFQDVGSYTATINVVFVGSGFKQF